MNVTRYTKGIFSRQNYFINYIIYVFYILTYVLALLFCCELIDVN